MSGRISEIVGILPMSTRLYLLFVEYDEGDAGNGVGHIQCTDGARQATLQGVLSTNDTLRSLWGSPSGALWTASENGNVWTSAQVKWPAARQGDLDSIALDPSLKWTVTTLPDLREEHYAPTLGALWGTSDSDVFVAASHGHIYHWDGTAWTQAHTAPGDVRAFTGSGPGDVYAVGHNATLLHYDGAVWTTMQSPPGGEPDEVFTGCCMGPDGALLACSMAGRLIHGNAGGLNVLGHDDDFQFRGIALLDNRMVLAAGADGVVEFRPPAFAALRSTFHALAVTAGRGKLLFLDAASQAAYVEYDPSHPTMQWARVKF